MSAPISRRRFLGQTAGGALATTAGGALATTACGAGGPDAHLAGVPADLVIDASVPLAAPALGFDGLRAELAARRAAGVDLVFAPVATREDLEGALQNALALRSHLARIPGEAVLVAGAHDLRQVRPRVGVVGHFHGLQMIGEQLALIARFRHAGVVVMQLTGCWKNWCADGCFEPGDLPLTGLGRMAVQEMAAADVVLDLAQAGRRSCIDALERSEGPVIVSRANAAAVHPHPQNLSDEQIAALRDRGAVIGVCAFPALLADEPRPGIDRLLRHLDHLVGRAGIDHVGLGLDFNDRPLRRFPDDPLPDPPYAYPPELAGAADIPALRERLRGHGYAEGDLRKLFGGNFARVLAAALRAAGS